MLKILLINGPSLGALGGREPGLYGTETLGAIVRRVKDLGRKLRVQVSAVQSNVEGVLIDHILNSERDFDGIIINPAAYTHTSVALRDAIQAISVPCVEVHLTNIAARENFRQQSLTAGACWGQISGFGAMGYSLALKALLERLTHGRTGKKTKRASA